MSKRFANSLFLVSLLLTSVNLFGQTPPCGRAVAIGGGASEETRFFAASPEYIKTSFVNALYAVAAKSNKVGDSEIKASTDKGQWDIKYRELRSLHVKNLSKAIGAMGTYTAKVVPDSQNGANGTKLTIIFNRGTLGSNQMATPLMEEVACLVKLIPAQDPQTLPAGTPNPDLHLEHKTLTLPEGTPIKVVLRNSLSSRHLKEHINDPVIFQVTEDVVVDNSIVIRRGALAVAHYSENSKTAGHWGRGANIGFEIETVTAADGQAIRVISILEKKRGDSYNTIGTGASAGAGKGAVGVGSGLLLDVTYQALIKGDEVFIRAGTGYDVETVGDHTIEVGK